MFDVNVKTGVDPIGQPYHETFLTIGYVFRITKKTIEGGTCPIMEILTTDGDKPESMPDVDEGMAGRVAACLFKVARKERLERQS